MIQETKQGNVINIHNLFLAKKLCEKAASWIKYFKSHQHLDFGCGEGFFAHYYASFLPQLRVVGYDSSQERINCAAAKYKRDNLLFTQTLDSGQFNSISCSFVFHETDTIKALEQIYPRLTLGGKLMVFDYDLKGLNDEQFRKIFACQRELEESERLGEGVAFKMHTSKGLDDFLAASQEFGFKTELSGNFLGNYFGWIGTKNQTNV